MQEIYSDFDLHIKTLTLTVNTTALDTSIDKKLKLTAEIKGRNERKMMQKSPFHTLLI